MKEFVMRDMGLHWHCNFKIFKWKESKSWDFRCQINSTSVAQISEVINILFLNLYFNLYKVSLGFEQELVICLSKFPF